MADHIKGSGQMVSNTVKVLLLHLKVNQEKVCGKMEKGLDGWTVILRDLRNNETTNISVKIIKFNQSFL